MRRNLSTPVSGHTARLRRVAARVEKLGVNQKQVAQVIDAWREELLEDVKTKGRANWPRIGVFYEARRKGRRVWRPAGPTADGDQYVKLPPMRKLALRASKHAKRVDDGQG